MQDLIRAPARELARPVGHKLYPLRMNPTAACSALTSRQDDAVASDPNLSRYAHGFDCLDAECVSLASSVIRCAGMLSTKRTTACAMRSTVGSKAPRFFSSCLGSF